MQESLVSEIKWRLPALSKKNVRFNDLIELKSEMRRTREQNYETDSEYQDYYISESFANRFPDLKTRSKKSLCKKDFS